MSTTKIIKQIKVIRQQTFTDTKVMGLRKCRQLESTDVTQVSN